MKRAVRIGRLSLGQGCPLFLIAGPCVIESESHCLMMARRLMAIAHRLGIPYIFKASFDKANRTSVSSYRGPGLDRGLLHHQPPCTPSQMMIARHLTV